MANIRRDTGRTTDIVQRQGSHERVGLEEEGEGLADTAWGLVLLL